MASPNEKIPEKPPKITGEEKKQRRLFFKKKRAGVVLSRDEVKAIKEGRKKLRKEMKARGIKSKREFELTAGALRLYFDKNHGFLAWLWGHWLGALLGLLLGFLLILFLFSAVQRMRGHYTINMSDDMFREGFVLSDTVGFENPTTQLFASPAEEAPCVSINQIPLDVDEIDGEHNDTYFAYTYYIRNEGESTVDYTWSLDINAETQDLSDAAWVIVFEDGVPRIYAKANKMTGREEALPAFGDDTKGYINLPIMELAGNSDQFEMVAEVGRLTYWRVIPDKFLSDTEITTGEQTEVDPMEVHKYTVVMFLEGDDAEATDEKIGGRLGVEMNFKLSYEEDEEESGFTKFFNRIFGGLKFV